VENDNNDELGQGVEVNHSSCTMYVSGIMKRDERAHIVPDDTVFNAPLGNSFGLLHSPIPIICGTRSSNHTIHRRSIHSWHRCWWGSMRLKLLRRADSSRLKAADC